MTPLKFGILGVSAHFIKRVLKPVQKLQSVEITGIASRHEANARKAAEKWQIPKYYGSYQALLDDPEIEAVFIPLPNHMHAEWIKKCADAGKDILCEKPLTLNAPEAREAVDYAQAKGVKIMEAFMYRFHPQWEHAKMLVDTGEIGGVQLVNTIFTYNNPDAGNIRNIKEYGGGGLMDIGCYGISVARFVTGQEPKKLVSQINIDQEFQTDNLTSVIIDFGKARGTFTVGTKTFPEQRVDIYGSSGIITIQIPFNTYHDVPAKITVTTKIGVREVQFDPADHYGLQFDAFAQAIKENKPVPTPIEDAINNMKVIDAIVASAETGQWVSLE